MENKIKFLENVQIKTGEFISSIPVKKAGTVLVVGAVIAGLGSIYWHRQKINEHTRLTQARTRMIEVQAAKNNIMLLDEETVKRIVAETIGVDGSQIEYKQVELMTKDSEQYTEKGIEHGKSYKKLMMNDEFRRGALSLEPGPIVTPTAKVDNKADNMIVPFYKVACKANGVKYTLQVEAVNGRLLTSRVMND